MATMRNSILLSSMMTRQGAISSLRQICDELEPSIGQQGGFIVDFHSCDIFPERWFDLVMVLRADNTILYDRLVQRGYQANKVTENVECEIMQVVLDEALGSYQEDIVVERQSDDIEQMEDNVLWIKDWMESFAN